MDDTDAAAETPRNTTTTVTLADEGGWIVARDEATGVASQGRTRAEALENLADAIALSEEPVPEETELREPDVPWFE